MALFGYTMNSSKKGREPSFNDARNAIRQRTPTSLMYEVHAFLSRGHRTCYYVVIVHLVCERFFIASVK